MGLAQNPKVMLCMWRTQAENLWLGNRRAEASVSGAQKALFPPDLRQQRFGPHHSTKCSFLSSLTMASFPSASPRRLHSNHLYCDCHLAWLSDWLRQRRTIGQFTLCMAPVHLRGFNVADVQKKEYVCPGEAAHILSLPGLWLSHPQPLLSVSRTLNTYPSPEVGVEEPHRLSQVHSCHLKKSGVPWGIHRKKAFDGTRC